MGDSGTLHSRALRLLKTLERAQNQLQVLSKYLPSMVFMCMDSRNQF